MTKNMAVIFGLIKNVMMAMLLDKTHVITLYTTRNCIMYPNLLNYNVPLLCLIYINEFKMQNIEDLSVRLRPTKILILSLTFIKTVGVLRVPRCQMGRGHFVPSIFVSPISFSSALLNG